MLERIIIGLILLVVIGVLVLKIKKFFQDSKSGNVNCSSCKGCDGGCDLYQK